MTSDRLAPEASRMRLFTNLPIAIKILATLGLMTILAIVVAGGEINELSRLNDVAQKLARDDARSLYLAASANERMTRAQQLMSEMILASDAAEIAGIDAQIERELTQLRELLAQLRPFMDGRQEEMTFREVSGALTRYGEQAGRARAAARADDDRKAQTLLRETVPTFRQADAALTSLVEQQTRDLDDAAARAQARFRVVVRTMLTVTAVGIVIALALSILIIRIEVTRPLRGMTRTMELLAGGQLELVVEGTDRRDEIGAMARSVRSSSKTPSRCVAWRPSSPRSPGAARTSAAASCAGSPPGSRAASSRSSRPWSRPPTA
jgi:methyl-accepting chemotaxis protein